MFIRWLKFNLVGAMGIGVQLGCLAILRSHLHYLAATALAVEIAVLHNFVWHQRFTWKERRDGSVGLRLLRFHLGNGLVSLVGNTCLMWLLVEHFQMMQVMAANGIAIGVCALANFALSEWFVFRPAVLYCDGTR